MNHIDPKISIITPTFNSAQFLDKALLSADHARVQHIVVDAGSRDGTVELLADWQKNSRLEGQRVWISESDDGQSDALNKGLALVRAPWIGWLNADERYTGETLDAALSVADSTQHTPDLIYGDFSEIDLDGRVLRRVRQHRYNRFILRSVKCYIPSCATFVRTSAVRAAGGWDTTMRAVMDQDLWLTLDTMGCTFRYDPRLHALFTRHPGQATELLADRLAEEEAVLSRRFGIPASLRRDKIRRLARVPLKLESYVRYDRRGLMVELSKLFPRVS